MKFKTWKVKIDAVGIDNLIEMTVCGDNREEAWDNAMEIITQLDSGECGDESIVLLPEEEWGNDDR